MAFAGVVPVAEVDRSIGRGLGMQAAEEGVVGGHEVSAVMGRVTRAISLGQIVIDAAAVDVDHEDGVAK